VRIFCIIISNGQGIGNISRQKSRREKSCLKETIASSRRFQTDRARLSKVIYGGLREDEKISFFREPKGPQKHLIHEDKEKEGSLHARFRGRLP
jgi:hypothetical protein